MANSSTQYAGYFLSVLFCHHICYPVSCVVARYVFSNLYFSEIGTEVVDHYSCWQIEVSRAPWVGL